MKKSTSSHQMAKIRCKIFGHSYKESRAVTSYITEYRCPHCNAEATTDEKGNFLTLTPQLRDINETLIYLCSKKRTTATSV